MPRCAGGMRPEMPFGGLAESGAGLCQRCRGAGCGNDMGDSMRLNPAVCSPQFTRDETVHLRQALRSGWIGFHELFSKPHGADGQADGLADALVLGQCDFTTAAAQVEEENTAIESGLVGHEP